MSVIAPLVVTMGDPAGIGPEITAAAWKHLRASGPVFVAVGHPRAYRDLPSLGVSIIEVDDLSQGAQAFETGLPVWRSNLPDIVDPIVTGVIRGLPCLAAAPATIGAIEMSVAAALAGAAAAVVTCPISKAVLYESGFVFPGHTEFVAHLCASPKDAPRPIMMLVGGGLRVALATVHVPLRAVPDLLRTDLIIEAACIVLDALERDFGVPHARLAVCGLNPHAGEGGALGREDAEVIAPAVQKLQADGHKVTGPHPADTLFHPDARSTYDAVLGMYHDQGLIPVKTLDFYGGVNVTLGLPIIRTSPDHGTAFDIAGRCVAKPDSLIAAIRLAGELAARRARSARS